MVKLALRLEMGAPTYDLIKKHTLTAEAMGYDSVWARDHVSLESTTGQAECWECWTTMTALAKDTSTIRIGSLVLCVPFRNPALLAKMSTTLDIISNGRLFLGLGAGHKASEFDEYGYHFPSNGERVTMLEETIQICRLMWTERRPSFTGKIHSITNALNEPKPVQSPPPILIGGTKPRMMGIIARYADAWNAVGSVDDYMAAKQQLETKCEAIGRDPASIEHYVSANILVDSTEAGAKKRLDKVLQERPGQQYLAQRISYGTPEQVAERIRPVVKAGANAIILHFWELHGQEEGIEAFAKDVLPLLE